MQLVIIQRFFTVIITDKDDVKATTANYFLMSSTRISRPAELFTVHEETMTSDHRF